MNNKLSLLGVGLSLGLLSAAVLAEGNRYDQERRYHSEVSASEAYVLTHYDRGNASGNPSSNAVLLDVRSIAEYVAGHPAGALNVPYPNIDASVNGMLTSEDKARLLVDAVTAAIPDKETPILVLCRTGSRSVAASNILADAGYTHVRNIWEGFEGRPKTDVNGNVLDLNNNGVVGDAGDLDGWKNHAGLPYTSALLPQLIYQPYSYLYYQ
ncbi:MAG TPA: rhodanese-like domain-containing protein [Gammaproteobacteria bacterium]